MVKLTAELIEQSAQYTNPLRDRELDLRGYKIPVIENLGATLDQFDTIDFSDNEIRKLEGFPLLQRLKCVIINNNRIKRIAESLEESLPYLESLVMTNNSMVELVDLEPLISVTTLRHLSLLKNPITAKRHYRLYVVHKMPHIRVLDFQKIKLKEREAAAKVFKTKKVAKEATAKKAKTFTPGERDAEATRPAPEPPATGPSREEVEAIKMAIANASTLEEVVRLKQMLQTGQIPGRKPDKADSRPEEEMETDVPNGT